MDTRPSSNNIAGYVGVDINPCGGDYRKDEPMKAYDDYLAQKAEEYNTPCQHYKCPTGRVEVCKRCDTYCEEYLEDVDLEVLADELVYYAGYIEDYPESPFAKQYGKKLELIKKELDRRSK